jgi:hypothetical protein
MVGRSIQEILIAFEVCAFVPFDIDAHRVHSGGRAWRVDMVLADLGLLVEFDSSYWHAGADKQAADARKSEQLRAAGWRVVRLREAPLTLLHPDERHRAVLRCQGHRRRAAGVDRGNLRTGVGRLRGLQGDTEAGQ